jgi:hypothetical protein
MPVPDFSPGEVLTAAAMDSIGLWKIAETSFTTAANPFINGCFSSDYQNYVVKFTCIASASGNNIYFRMRSGVNTPETSAVYDRFGFSWATSASNLVSANQVDGYLGDITNVTSASTAGTLDFFRPNETVATIVNTHNWGGGSGSVFFPSYRIETTTAYTGIELFPLSGTLTGTMRVYGYRN